MSSFAKNVILPCALLVGAVYSLWKYVDWSVPQPTAEDEERELAERCDIIQERMNPYDGMPGECLDLRERIRDRESRAHMEEWCPKIGGEPYGNRLCVRKGEGGVEEYTDGPVASWYDCLDHFVSETDEGYCPDHGCLVHAPFWCPELRGFRSVDGTVHRD